MSPEPDDPILPPTWPGSSRERRAASARLFSRVARRYEPLVQALSLRQDRRWKRDLVAALPLQTGARVLDVGSGTGSLARVLAARFGTTSVVSGDVCAAMLDEARRRSLPSNVRQVVHDMSSMPFPDATFEAVTASYALRNAQDLDGTLTEIARVLKRGGVLAFLELSNPSGRWTRAVHGVVLGSWARLCGFVVLHDARACDAILDTLSRFPCARSLDQMLLRHGFRVLSRRRHFAGITEATVCVADA